jgi:NTE family protein
VRDGHALVLGGGGVAGAAWITGLLAGLAEAGQDITGADVIIGTSAGSVVGAQLGSGLPLADLLARQAEPARQTAEIPAQVSLATMAAEMGAELAGVKSPAEMLRRIGAYAVAARTVPESARRAVIESRLPARAWPERALRITAVDVRTGGLRVFDRDSGVSLVDAVAASCAVPGIWPSVTIGGRRYMDGGVRSADNADLAAGYSRITVVSPLGANSPIPSPMPLRTVVGQLRDGGSEVTVLTPDAASVAAIGPNPLDPATRTPAARAGLAQGRAGPQPG